MKLQTLIVLGAALIALDAVQASYAATDAYFPATAEQSAQQSTQQSTQPAATAAATELPRVSVRAEALASAKDAPPTTLVSA